MEIKRVPIDQVEPWEKNPRGIKRKDFDRLKKQITELGIYKPLVCTQENGRYIILGGNMRIRALRELGAQKVDVSVVEAKTEAEKLKYALSDNDRAGEYDDQALAELLFANRDGIDLEDFRIDIGPTISLERLMTSFGPDIAVTEEDIVPEPEKTSSTPRGALFDLGPHRLLCGDATQEWAYAALMDGMKADLIFTDPPYNVAYKGSKLGTIAGDDMTEEEFIEFSCRFMAQLKENTKRGGAFYICSGYSSYPVFLYALHQAGLTFSTPIVWVKNNTSLGWGDYRHKHEMLLKGRSSRQKKSAQPILYGWKGGRHYFPESRFEADVWEMNRRGSSNMLHPTQKPLGLIQRAIRNSSRKGECVLDPFAGSGSTLVGAEREGRVAYVMDLDPLCVDTTIRRYAALGAQTEEEIRQTCRLVPIRGEQGRKPKLMQGPARDRATSAIVER